MRSPEPVYLDHHAASPLCREALEAMERTLRLGAGNPASVHRPGRVARAALEHAREQVASALGAHASHVLFTSGGTEACNLGVLGLAGDTLGRVITTAIEHPAVRASLDALAARGFEITELPVLDGRAPTAAALSAAFTDDTRLLCVQWINHETGTVLPVEDYAALARSHGARIFVDAVQAVGKRELAFGRLGVDALAVASHKAGGPAGAGALLLARGVALTPHMLGGGQERGLRAGTPDLAALVGFGAAATTVSARLARQTVVGALRDELERALVASGARVNGTGGPRVGTVSDVSFPGWRGSTLVAALDLEGLAVASGAACSSGRDRPSAVVAAMYPEDAARAAGAVRFSLGVETTAEEIARAVEIVRTVLARPPA